MLLSKEKKEEQEQTITASKVSDLDGNQVTEDNTSVVPLPKIIEINQRAGSRTTIIHPSLNKISNNPSSRGPEKYIPQKRQ
jgi:hypothetical protein